LLLSLFAGCGKQAEEKTDGPTEPTEPTKPALTGTVTISGEGKEDTPLTAETSVTDPFYQWFVDGVPVDNANSQVFQVPVNAAGKAITVSVGADGYDGSILSEGVTATANPSDYKSMAGLYPTSKILGRVFLDKTDPTAAHIEWPASGFEFNIHAEGDSLKIYYDTAYESTLAVFIDGVMQERPILIRKSGGFYCTFPITPGDHTVRIVREFEPQTHDNYFQLLKGVEFVGTVKEAPAKKDIYIEIIGDSTATGSGAMGVHRPGQGFLTTDYSNTSSFGYQVAQSLDADYSIVAKGNCGFLNGDIIQNKSMTDVYEYWWRWHNEDKYTFLRCPDLIIMKIGMNDSAGAGHSLETFKEGAKNFILRLREIYGYEPVILWFDSATSNNYRESQYTTMQQLQKELGDENFYVAQFRHGFDGAGPATSASGLPSAQNQRDIADQIIDYLNNVVKFSK
jgi:hypothetical protein